MYADRQADQDWVGPETSSVPDGVANSRPSSATPATSEWRQCVRVRCGCVVPKSRRRAELAIALSLATVQAALVGSMALRSHVAGLRNFRAWRLEEVRCFGRRMKERRRAFNQSVDVGSRLPTR